MNPLFEGIQNKKRKVSDICQKVGWGRNFSKTKFILAIVTICGYFEKQCILYHYLPTGWTHIPPQICFEISNRTNMSKIQDLSIEKVPVKIVSENYICSSKNYQKWIKNFC